MSDSGLVRRSSRIQQATTTKEVEEKLAERASRKGRGLKRANTFFEYEGHPETRETADNPFGDLVGKRVEVRFPKEKSWKQGQVVEHDGFNGLHTVLYDDGKRVMHDFSKRSYRLVGSAKAEVPPTKPVTKKKRARKSKPTAAAASATAAATSADSGTDDEDDGHDIHVDDSHDHTTPAGPAHHTSTTSAGVPTATGERKVDPESGLASEGHLLQEDGTAYDAEAAYLDLAHNHDKYYIVQVIESTDKTKYWAFFRWGRTGTKGQSQVHGPSDKDTAVALFKDKFKEKTGLDFADRDAAPVASKYRVKKRETTPGQQKSVKWQYYVDDFVDGKATGWYNYTEVASRTVEGVHSEWKHNHWLDVRCVTSGYFQYRVDFNMMQQTNLKTSKMRKIRRVDA